MNPFLNLMRKFSKKLMMDFIPPSMSFYIKADGDKKDEDEEAPFVR